jgi:pantoate--beta-alanine ligase
MEIVNRISRMAAVTAKIPVSEVKIGLVPTSGAINPGHIDLIQAARKMADLVIVSIFVNRLEFASDEEYRAYPQDVTSDVDLLRQESVDYIFTPSEDEMYPANFSTYVEVQRQGSEISGLPLALFKGMSTGILKLLHITRPAFVFYAEKDGIQGAILRKMIKDLNITTEVVIMPVDRESSGLAYEGRNRLLSESQLEAAAVIYRSLKAAAEAVESGERQARKVLAQITRTLHSEPLTKLEYAIVADPETLEPVARIERAVLLGVGARLGNVFLSDALLLHSP